MRKAPACGVALTAGALPHDSESLLSQLCPIAVGRKPGLFFEQLDEVIDVLKTAFGRDFLHGFCGELQQVNAACNTLLVNIVREGASNLFVKQRGQIAAVYV